MISPRRICTSSCTRPGRATITLDSMQSSFFPAGNAVVERIAWSRGHPLPTVGITRERHSRFADADHAGFVIVDLEGFADADRFGGIAAQFFRAVFIEDHGVRQPQIVEF